MVIYKTTNLVNGKQYIGRDSRNRNGYLGSGSLLKKAMRKYGKENFKKEILEVCSSHEELIERESYWLNYYDAGNNPDFYNMHNLSAGSGKGQPRGCRGEKHYLYGKSIPPETRKKMGESRSGERNPMYGIRGEKNPNYGRKPSDETKRKLAESKFDAKNPNFKGLVLCISGDYIGERKTPKEWASMFEMTQDNFYKHIGCKSLKNGIKGNFFKREDS